MGIYNWRRKKAKEPRGVKKAYGKSETAWKEPIAKWPGFERDLRIENATEVEHTFKTRVRESAPNLEEVTAVQAQKGQRPAVIFELQDMMAKPSYLKRRGANDL